MDLNTCTNLDSYPVHLEKRNARKDSAFQLTFLEKLKTRGSV